MNPGSVTGWLCLCEPSLNLIVPQLPHHYNQGDGKNYSVVVKVINCGINKCSHQFKGQHRSGRSALVAILITLVMCHCSGLLGIKRKTNKRHPRQICVKGDCEPADKEGQTEFCWQHRALSREGGRGECCFKLSSYRKGNLLVCPP